MRTIPEDKLLETFGVDLDTGAVAPTAAAKCRPHRWATPAVGDDALRCEDCGRALRFMEDVTVDIRASIIVAYGRRCGDDAGDTFGAAFDAARDDARRRYVPAKRAAVITPYVDPQPRWSPSAAAAESRRRRFGGAS